MLLVGIDPSKAATGFAVVQWRGLTDRPLLRLCRCIEDGTLAEVSAATDAAWAKVYDIAQAEGLSLHVAAEVNFAGPGAQAHDAILLRLGMVLAGAWSAGLDLGGVVQLRKGGPAPGPADVSVWVTAQWGKQLGVARSKQGSGAGKGLHRIVEAERIVDCGAALRSVDHAVDRAEAVLLAAAEAYRRVGVVLPDTVESKAKTPKRRTKAA